MIFVFGSNLAGRHGKGAALTAFQKHGALYGQGHGRQGNSYAIATCGKYFEPLPLILIKFHVEGFLGYAEGNFDNQFQVTRIGCGLGRHKDEDIAPMFSHASDNVFFDNKWEKYLGASHEYWGTHPIT